MARLAKKVAIITGAGGGVGRAAALRFADEGAAVAAVDVNPDTCAATVRMVEAGGRAALCIVADVSVEADCARMVTTAEAEFGSLHVLFNNAGIFHPDDGDAVETTAAVWQETMAVNALGVFLGCKYGIPALRRAGGGAIINTASFVARMGAAVPQIAYTASKGAVLALTRELAVFHAREGIRVNALCPGPLQTEMLASVLDTDAKRERRLTHIPMGRFGLVEEIAEAAVWLASDESSYTTGAEFMVDGGITAAYLTPE